MGPARNDLSANQAPPPTYEESVHQNRLPSPLLKIVSGQLHYIRLSENPETENRVVRELIDFLVDSYPSICRLRSHPREASQTDFGRFEGFLRQLNAVESPLLFHAVDHSSKLHQTGYLLTSYRNRCAGVTIRLCKLPDVVASAQRLVRSKQYSTISNVCQSGWAHQTELNIGDKVLSVGSTHLESAPHDEVVKELSKSRDSTKEPLCFFHHGTARFLVICTPLVLCKPIGITVI